MLLGLGMHVGSTNSHDRGSAVEHLVALTVNGLAQGLSQKLDVPLGYGLQVVTIRHHNLHITAILLSSDEFQHCIQQGRVLPYIIPQACLIHILGTVQECLDIKAADSSQHQSHIAEDGETAAYAIRNAVLRPVVIHSQLLQQGWLLLVRIGNSHNLNLDIRILLQGIIDNHEVGHGIQGAAGLGNNHQAYHKLALLVAQAYLGASCQLADNIAGPSRVDILAAEINLRQAVTLLSAHGVPELAALHVKDYLVAQVGTANAQGNHCINAVSHGVGQLLQMCHGGRVVQMAFLNIWQLGEINLLRGAILGKMATDNTVLPHDLDSLGSSLDLVRQSLHISLGYLAFAYQIVIVKGKAGFQS